MAVSTPVHSSPKHPLPINRPQRASLHPATVHTFVFSLFTVADAFAILRPPSLPTFIAAMLENISSLPAISLSEQPRTSKRSAEWSGRLIRGKNAGAINVQGVACAGREADSGGAKLLTLSGSTCERAARVMVIKSFYLCDKRKLVSQSPVTCKGFFIWLLLLYGHDGI